METYGVDFVARCIAGEGLETANKRQWKLKAGPGVILSDNPSTQETTISATGEEITVDDALSTTSENPVQNKVITNELLTKPTCVLPDGNKVNNQKIMQLTKAQYDAIQNKDNNTYYMITDDAVDEGYTAGTGIDITNKVISLDVNYGASLEMTIDPNTYVVTTVLKDQNGNTLGQVQTIDLPLESVVVSGRYDTATKTIILTLEGGSTISIPVGDLVNGLESTTNKVTSIGAGSTNTEYPSAKAVYDAIQNIDEVPDATAADAGKVLTVDSTGNAEWITPSTGVTDYTLLNNKPSINNVELNGNKTAADLGLVESSELNNYLTISNAATLYQPKGIGVGKNVDDTSFTLDGTTYTADTGCEVFNHSPYDMSTTNKASGYWSHVEGNGNTIATGSGESNHAEGSGNTIIGDNANHIEGQGNRISNSVASCNHVEGGANTLTSSGAWHHIEGTQNTISGSALGCHAEGAQNTATGDYAHVEGGGNTASGSYSHAQGYNTVASGAQSTSVGLGTIAAGSQQVAIGRYNVATANDDTYPLVVGNGTNNNNRSDCFKVDKTGKIYVGNNPNGVDVTAIKEVPTTLAGDAGKVLTATGAGAYQWSAIPTPANMEVTTNKVTSLSASSTDTQYPSAKCVYDLIGDVETILATLTTP